MKARGVPLWYVEGLNDARTKLAGFFSILLSRWIRGYKYEYPEALVCVILYAMFFTSLCHGPLPWTKHLFF